METFAIELLITIFITIAVYGLVVIIYHRAFDEFPWEFEERIANMQSKTSYPKRKG